MSTSGLDADLIASVRDANEGSNRSPTTMLAWTPMIADQSSPETSPQPVVARFLYRLTLAFPSSAGAIMAVYSIFLYKFGVLKIRPR